jgi:hypothetical protein
VRLVRAQVALLDRLEWQAFVTLTYRRLPGPCVEMRMMFAWIRRVGRAAGCRRRGLCYLWAFRRELGEIGDRPHLHGLIGGLPGWFARDFVLRPRPAVGAWWEELGGGNVRTRACSRSGAAEYISDSSGMDLHERGKFAGEWFMLGEHASRLTEWREVMLREQAATGAADRTAREIVPDETGRVKTAVDDNLGKVCAGA